MPHLRRFQEIMGERAAEEAQDAVARRRAREGGEPRTPWDPEAAAKHRRDVWSHLHHVAPKLTP